MCDTLDKGESAPPKSLREEEERIRRRGSRHDAAACLDRRDRRGAEVVLDCEILLVDHTLPKVCDQARELVLSTGDVICWCLLVSDVQLPSPSKDDRWTGIVVDYGILDSVSAQVLVGILWRCLPILTLLPVHEVLPCTPGV